MHQLCYLGPDLVLVDAHHLPGRVPLHRPVHGPRHDGVDVGQHGELQGADSIVKKPNVFHKLWRPKPLNSETEGRKNKLSSLSIHFRIAFYLIKGKTILFFPL